MRALETADDPTRLPLGDAPPRLSWVVLDETHRRDAGARGSRRPGGFPSTVAGLPVRGVADALEARRAGLAPDVVAVAGWLRAWADPQACTHPIEGLPGGGCPGRRSSWTGPGPTGPRAPARTSGRTCTASSRRASLIPDRAVGLAVADLGPPPPVVVIGRFGASDTGCTRDLRGCDEQLTIEAVVWSSGRSMAPGRQVAAGLVAPLDLVAASVTDPGVGPPDGVVRPLRVVLARASDLAALDPAAAAVLRPAGMRPATPVWYVRGLATDGTTISWAVVEPGTGRVLARGNRAADRGQARSSVGRVGHATAGDRQPHDPAQLPAQERRVLAPREQRLGRDRPGPGAVHDHEIRRPLPRGARARRPAAPRGSAPGPW